MIFVRFRKRYVLEKGIVIYPEELCKAGQYGNPDAVSADFNLGIDALKMWDISTISIFNTYIVKIINKIRIRIDFLEMLTYNEENG